MSAAVATSIALTAFSRQSAVECVFWTRLAPSGHTDLILFVVWRTTTGSLLGADPIRTPWLPQTMTSLGSVRTLHHWRTEHSLVALPVRTFAKVGNARGTLEGSRRAFSADFIRTLADDFRLNGRQAIEKVRKTQPAAYMKICALLVPREMKVEHSNVI